MLQIHRAVSTAQAVVLAHSTGQDVQRQVADILFARAWQTAGFLASLGGLFCYGPGDDYSAYPPHFKPEKNTACLL